MSMGTLNRVATYALILSQLALAGAGCRQEGASRGPGGGAGVANAATSGQRVSLGEVAFRVLRRNVEVSDPTDNPQGKVAAFDARHDEFVTAIDTVVPAQMAAGLPSTLDEVAGLIRDGTLPALTDNVARILDLLALDPQDPQRVTLNALAKLATSRSVIEKEQALKLAGRMAAYPEIETLLRSIAGVVQENDGLTAQGAPAAAEKDLVTDLLGLLSRRLEGLARPTVTTTHTPPPLVKALLEPVDLRGGLQVGAPAWGVRADANGNGKVSVNPSTGRLYAPFVDANRDGVADVNADGDPIDAQGAKVAIMPFGAAGSRDADGRALASDGRLLFEYFDVKKTVMGQVLLLAGKLCEREVITDTVSAADACSTRVTRSDASGSYTAYADDNPMTDLAWGLLEIFRYRDAPKLLDSLAALIKNDPRRAERIMVSLVNVLEILDRQPLVSTPSQGGRSLLDDMVPLLDRVFESNGAGQASADSLAKVILDTFRTEMQRLRQIPHGLAEMMKYSDYAARTPTAPGQKSCLEQLMDMIAEANGCDSWPFGNMAEFYLNAMAGNQRILGISISVYTCNQLLDIPFLRSLLCSRISAGNIRALHAFAQSGALDSLIPIVKAFSDRGQTAVIKNIFLALGASYATTLRPNEAALVSVLDSGIVEELFDALNVLAGMTVPGTGERVTDVTAQFLASIVDDDRGVVNRRNVRHTSLLHLLVKPLDAMQQRIDQRGARPAFDRAFRNIVEVALATTMISSGTTQNPTQEKALLYHGLVKLTAAGLEALSKSMSMDPTTRNRDVTTYQADVVSLLTGRDVPVLADTLLAVERSPSKRVLLDSIVNVFTPNLNQRHDIYGAVLEVASAALQAKASDPTALVDVLRFGGKVLAPARGIAKPIVTSLVKLLGGQSGTILGIVRNALDKGPAGNAKAPAETLLEILDDVSAASTRPSQGATAQGIADMAKDAAAFIRDGDKGLEAIYTHLRGARR